MKEKMSETIILVFLSFVAAYMFFQLGRYAGDRYFNVQADEMVTETVYDNQSATATETVPDNIWTIRAYCNCEKCCTDAEAVGAQGKPLTSGYSCAASSDIPYDTILMIEGYGRVCVQDRIPSSIEMDNPDTIHIYFDTHAEAVAFGKKQAAVYPETGK